MIDLALFRNPVFAWANIAMVLLSISFGIQLLGLVFWLQEGWGWSAVRTGLGIAPGPVMVSVTALGLRRWIAKLPVNVVAAIGRAADGRRRSAHRQQPHRPAALCRRDPARLADHRRRRRACRCPRSSAPPPAGWPPHQTSTGSAVVQMGRQIGSVLGVALLVVVIGSSHDHRRQAAPVRPRLVVGRPVRAARRGERADHASTEAGVGPYARPVSPRAGSLTLDRVAI